ncbi:MAG: ketoacyl-ACP synthase III [Thermoguttaceae bacterium]|nr:ketoacyl-ACP synthase III [Thermoguttaceae bacterium]
MGRLMGVQVVGIGSSVPDYCVRNEDLASLGHDTDWIVQRTGIYQRRHAPEGVATSDLATEAARRAMDSAGVSPDDIDLLILGTFTPDMPLPATACLVQDRLGLRAPAMDIQAACASFVYAMYTAMQFVATGSSKLALVIGADCNSRIVNPADARIYPLFGDGAGAVILAPGSPEQGFLSCAFGSDGSGADLLCRRMGGSRLPFHHGPSADGLHYMHMEGRPIFKWAVRLLHNTTTDVLRAVEMSIEDIDLVVFHQANLRIINAAAEELKIDQRQMFNNVDRYGNTSAGSIPLVLDEAQRAGRINRGDHILLSGFGAGLVWGTALIRW